MRHRGATVPTVSSLPQGPLLRSRAPTSPVPFRAFVFCCGSKRSLVLSLVGQARTWSPRHLHLSHLPCLSLSQAAAAASRASGHSRPQPPSHIEHPLPTPQLLFFLFYTVTSSRWTGSALATPPLTPSREVPGTHPRQSAHADTHFSLFTWMRPTSAVSRCAPCTREDGYRKSADTHLCSIFARPDIRKCV